MSTYTEGRNLLPISEAKIYRNTSMFDGTIILDCSTNSARVEGTILSAGSFMSLYVNELAPEQRLATRMAHIKNNGSVGIGISSVSYVSSGSESDCVANTNYAKDKKYEIVFNAETTGTVDFVASGIGFYLGDYSTYFYNPSPEDCLTISETGGGYCRPIRSISNPCNYAGGMFA